MKASINNKSPAHAVKVSEQSIFRRVNRKLAKDNKALRSSRPGNKDVFYMGRYYVLDFRSWSVGELCEKHIDLEVLARKLGALKANERMVNKEQS